MRGNLVGGLSHHLPDIDHPVGVGGHVLGTALAAAAAALFAVGSVAVHGATAESGTGGAPRWRLPLRQPAWLVGQAATVVAALLQVVASGWHRWRSCTRSSPEDSS